ncbi:MAG: hypothetical protein QW165_01140 [Candidatus Woesearchaeota archaeon]
MNTRTALTIAGIIAGITLLLSLTNFTLWEAFRFSVLGFAYLFLPGYALSIFLLKEADIIQRIAVAILLSLALLPLPNLFASVLGFYIYPSAQFAAIALLYIGAYAYQK